MEAPPVRAVLRAYCCEACGVPIGEVLGHGRKARLMVVTDDALVLTRGTCEVVCRKCGHVNIWRQRRRSVSPEDAGSR